jgi:hypothetical protein
VDRGSHPSVCNQVESLEHLFFQCTVAKCVWGTVGICLGTDSIPGNINQYKRWIKESLPGGEQCVILASQLYVGQCEMQEQGGF